ncbi:MAG: outer membrane lipoprotein-sorting protein [Saprospiraceae bacterium]|nr:outer membrane lipoprotein-sorting protein [Saprospiraceae bacterium]
MSFLTVFVFSQSALEIVKKSDDKFRGISSYSVLKMQIKRADWSREMKMKAWSKGEDESLILITSPKRDQGITFMKKKNEMWNWQPTIQRVIKMPPSMMMQSWMGSDFTNDDLARQSSIVNDYIHKIIGEEKIDGKVCFIIELKPKEDAPVVWGKVKMWISKNDFLQLKAQFYDEDNYLVNTIYSSNIKEIGGRVLPTVMKLVPADEPKNSTTMEYELLEFGVKFKQDFFSVKNMKVIR